MGTHPRPDSRIAADYLFPDAGVCMPLGKIGDDVFVIGSEKLMVAKSSGTLFLSVNQRWKAEYWRNNTQGTYQVSVIRDHPDRVQEE